MSFNIVTFQPDPPANADGSPGDAATSQMAITLEGPFTLKGGLKPDINQATCSYKEIAKLGLASDGTINANQTGTLQFWFSNSPGGTSSGDSGGSGSGDGDSGQGDSGQGGSGQGDSGGGDADVSIANIAIIDVDVAEVGIVAGETEARVIIWRLYLADFREKFVSPRGGRLEQGLINPDILQSATGQQDSDESDDSGSGDTGDSGGSGGDDSGGADAGGSGGSGGDDTNTYDADKSPARQFSDLITLCLTAMGLADVSVPTTVNQIDAPRNLKWFGNHAPTELDKLLQQCGHVFVPLLNGSASIYKLGDGPPPNIPGGQQILDVPFPGIDRRGKNVVFTSYPHASIVTQDTSGPNPHQTPQPEGWQFVAQDSDGVWKNIETLNCCPNVFSAITKQFAGTGDDQVRLQQQVMFCVQYVGANGTAAADANPILTRVFEIDGSGELAFNAKHAVQDPSSGTWSNVASDIRVVQKIHLGGDQGNILILAEWLGQVSSPQSPDVYTSFQQPMNGDWYVRLSWEDVKQSTDANNNTVYLPQYFSVGFQQPLGANMPSQLSDNDLKNLLQSNDRDTLIVPKPEWVLKKIDGDDANKDDLTKAAKAAASVYLRGSGSPMRVMQASGFVDGGDLNGTLSEISYDQDTLITRFKIGTWFAPASNLVDLQRFHRDIEHGAYPHETREHEARAAVGAAGATAPVIPFNPPATAPTAASGEIDVALTQDGGDAGSAVPLAACTFTYTAKSLDGKTTYGTNLQVYDERPHLGPFNAATEGRLVQQNINGRGTDGPPPATLLWANETEPVIVCSS